MDTDPPLLVTSAPAIQVNQPYSAVPINEAQSSTTPDRKMLQYYNSKAAATTGIIQISCGLVAFILEIAYLTTAGRLHPVGNVAVGIWGGAMFGITGVIGIFSSKKKRGMIITYFVLSIISSIVALVGLSFDIHHLQMSRFYYDYNGGAVAVSVLSIVVNIIEGLTAIVASSFGCAARLCCGGEPVIHERVIYMPPQGPAHAYPGFQPPIGLPPSYESNQQIEEKHGASFNFSGLQA